MITIESVFPKIDTTYNLASGMYERLQKHIENFIKTLDDTQHPLLLVGDLIVEDIGYHNPHLLIFHGTDLQGNPTRKFVHINALNMDLKALKTQDAETPKRPIGFLGPAV